MNKFAVVLLTLSLFACAGAEGKFDDAHSKVDEVKAKIECMADAVKPFEKYLSKKQVSMVLTGELDAVEVLKSLEVTPSEVFAAKDAVEACLK